MKGGVFLGVLFKRKKTEQRNAFLRAPFVFNSPGQGWSFALSFGERFSEKPGELLFGFGFAFGSR
jgi:hypothetical protein